MNDSLVDYTLDKIRLDVIKEINDGEWNKLTGKVSARSTYAIDSADKLREEAKAKNEPFLTVSEFYAKASCNSCYGRGRIEIDRGYGLEREICHCVKIPR